MAKQTIPAKRRAPMRKEFESDQSSESESEIEQDIDEMSSEELDDALEEFEGSSGPENEHGFVFAHNLNTYKLNKKERIEQEMREKEGKLGERKDYQKKRDKKRNRKFGKTNTEKLKNKPMAMVLPKKVKDMKVRSDKEAKKSKIKKSGVFFGKWKKHTS
jgi:RecA-family ATPase